MNINHYGAVRARVTGAGNLKLKLMSLDDVYETILTPIVMSVTTDKYPNILSNFMQQKAQLEISTTDYDDVFLIREILIYSKPVFTSYPQ